jgi:AraC-like DNA-binding protein
MTCDGASLRWSNCRIQTANVMFGEAVSSPGGSCGPRLQHYYQLLVLHSGGGCATVAREHRPLKVGQVYLLKPGFQELFQFSLERETHHSYCSIKPPFLAPDFRRNLNHAPWAVTESEAFRLLLEMVFKMRRPDHRATQYLVEALGRCLFAEYLRTAALEAGGQQQELAVRRFLEYVHDHLSEETCLAGGRIEAGVSPNALIYQFRSAMRTTPARYVWRARTERGVAMLRETGLTVAEISYRCGFKSPFHFSRMVKQHLGYSPRWVRKASRA